MAVVRKQKMPDLNERQRTDKAGEKDAQNHADTPLRGQVEHSYFRF